MQKLYELYFIIFVDDFVSTQDRNVVGHPHNQYVHIVQDLKVLVMGGVLVLVPTILSHHCYEPYRVYHLWL